MRVIRLCNSGFVICTVNAAALMKPFSIVHLLDVNLAHLKGPFDVRSLVYVLFPF